jgi:phage tail sheath protein FI
MGILAANTSAQVKYQASLRDSIKVSTPVRVTTTVAEQIRNGLYAILNKYKTEPNEEATWIKIRAEADAFLYGWFKSGKLLGTKSEQAYFVKMGLQTMTPTDIANGKKIFLAGIADKKPAEFLILTIETR